MGEGLKIDVCIVGGGMITNDLILPSVYHLQRIGVAGKISICALNNGPLRATTAAMQGPASNVPLTSNHLAIQTHERSPRGSTWVRPRAKHARACHHVMQGWHEQVRGGRAVPSIRPVFGATTCHG